MTKTNFDLSAQFRHDLLEAYNNDKCAPVALKQWQAYDHAVKSKAKRYYVTPKQAFQVLAPLIKGDFTAFNKRTNNDRKRMYISLLETTLKLIDKRQFKGKSLFYIMHFAVLQPAPEFFCNWRTLQKIHQFHLEGRFEQSNEKFYGPYDPDIKPKKRFNFTNARV